MKLHCAVGKPTRFPDRLLLSNRDASAVAPFPTSRKILSSWGPGAAIAAPDWNRGGSAAFKLHKSAAANAAVPTVKTCCVADRPVSSPCGAFVPEPE